uniref:Uncharacterized protein n=1 Tax=Arundo donax TaxID=35708 RepID=A0A0A9E0R9_ARUDO
MIICTSCLIPNLFFLIWIYLSAKYSAHGGQAEITFVTCCCSALVGIWSSFC